MSKDFFSHLYFVYPDKMGNGVYQIDPGRGRTDKDFPACVRVQTRFVDTLWVVTG